MSSQILKMLQNQYSNATEQETAVPSQGVMDPEFFERRKKGTKEAKNSQSLQLLTVSY